MRIILANSNTSAEVTAAMLGEARRAASPETEIVGVNAAFGARIVGTRAENAIAGHALIDMLAEHAASADAVLVGMSFDTGLWAAREILDVPVARNDGGRPARRMHLGATARHRRPRPALGRRSIARSWPATAWRSRVAGDRWADADAAGPAGGPRERRVRHPREHRAARRDNGRRCRGPARAPSWRACPRRLQDRSPVPLVDGISSGIVLAEALARLRPARPRSGSLAPIPPRESVGLRPALAIASFEGWPARPQLSSTIRMHALRVRHPPAAIHRGPNGEHCSAAFERARV